MVSSLNMVSVLLILIFLYPILKGFIFRFSYDFAKKDINGIVVSISLVIGIIVSVFFAQQIFIKHDTPFFINIYNKIPQIVINPIENNPLYIYLLVTPIFTIVFYSIFWKILDFFAKKIIFPIISTLETGISRLPGLLKRIIGMVMQIPRAICYVLVVAMLLNLYSVINKSNKLNNQLAASKVYNSICENVIIPVTNSKIAKQLPSVINNSFKIQIKPSSTIRDSIAKSSGGNINDGTIVYYNGVTLDEAVKSNSRINIFAKNITSDLTDERQKAKKLYSWIGQNISYDEDKATSVMNNDFSKESGAIPAFNTRKGICFDYACLYVAMCRSCNIKVRIVTGKGYSGASWVNHAWNQVYLKNEGLWVNVDPTFYKCGNYFDSQNFKIDHISDGVAGEW